MSSFSKFNSFVEDLAHGAHAFNSAALYVYLTNQVPSSSDTIYDGTAGVTAPAEINAQNGYAAGGVSVTVSSSSQTAGIYTLVLADPPLITASGGSIGPFRYIVLYNSTSADRLIGYWDYGSTITLNDTESFQIDFSQTNGVLSLV